MRGNRLWPPSSIDELLLALKKYGKLEKKGASHIANRVFSSDIIKDEIIIKINKTAGLLTAI
jgi:hypothetical protein